MSIFIYGMVAIIHQEDSRDVEWFHEGLTNYYAIMSLVFAGLISEDELLKYLSAIYLNMIVL
jgi:predicted metalloprotease with PDZ domain